MEEIKYLKISELEEGKYYTCGLSGNKVFILNIFNTYDNNLLANGIYYTDGDYAIYTFKDYMLY